jgi:hypothetical protein
MGGGLGQDLRATTGVAAVACFPRRSVRTDGPEPSVLTERVRDGPLAPGKYKVNP